MIALWKRMSRLLGQNAHELLKGSAGLAHLELNQHSVTIDEIRCKRRIVVRVEPLPRLAAPIIVSHDPLQPFNIALLDLGCELLDIASLSNHELIGVVPHFPPFNA